MSLLLWAHDQLSLIFRDLMLDTVVVELKLYESDYSPSSH